MLFLKNRAGNEGGGGRLILGIKSKNPYSPCGISSTFICRAASLPGRDPVPGFPGAIRWIIPRRHYYHRLLRRQISHSTYCGSLQRAYKSPEKFCIDDHFRFDYYSRCSKSCHCSAYWHQCCVCLEHGQQCFVLTLHLTIHVRNCTYRGSQRFLCLEHKYQGCAFPGYAVKIRRTT